MIFTSNIDESRLDVLNNNISLGTVGALFYDINDNLICEKSIIMRPDRYVKITTEEIESMKPENAVRVLFIKHETDAFESDVDGKLNLANQLLQASAGMDVLDIMFVKGNQMLSLYVSGVVAIQSPSEVKQNVEVEGLVGQFAQHDIYESTKWIKTREQLEASASNDIPLAIYLANGDEMQERLIFGSDISRIAEVLSEAREKYDNLKVYIYANNQTAETMLTLKQTLGRLGITVRKIVEEGTQGRNVQMTPRRASKKQQHAWKSQERCKVHIYT